MLIDWRCVFVVGEIVGLIFKPCKGFGLISQLLKQVMHECNLRQADLAELLGVSLSRVKAMTSGRVKNITREEPEALVKKLHIRGDWLATG
ncbi:MAG: helix-turn-helix transcriptional regulator, partial [Burkholderiaceae bacterium]|nr:helix-turn-helix transcriptional regulator [Burkholderiaceae bacterium]